MAKIFVNPYHFIPLQEKCKKEIKYVDGRAENDANSKTGWIECEIETKTPIFIPNTTNDDFFHERQNGVSIKSYDFYSYKDNKEQNTQKMNEAIIPGSSIRGTIRSAFETLTNSCLSTTDDNHILYKRVTSPASPGRLVKRDNDWVIVECQKYMLKTRDCWADNSPEHNISSYKEGESIYFSAGDRYKNKRYMPIVVTAINKNLNRNCNIMGYLHKGEPFGQRKHHESVFVETDTTHPATKRDIENLLENYKLFQDKTVNLHYKQGEHGGYESNIEISNSSKLDKLNGALIYFVEYNGKFYLSPAAIGREVFHNRLKDLLSKGDYSPCTTHEKLCPTCALFGFAGKESKKDDDKKKNAIASRVRFSDAKSDNLKFLEPVILPELAGPKASATELYMKKPNGRNVAIWNYDYAEITQNRNKSILNGYSPQIQGRKMYWHQGGMKTFENENKRFDYEAWSKKKKRNVNQKIEYSDRLVKVRPVDKGVNFTFKVHFNQITENELKQLLWVLSIGGKDGLAHKIGMGKPAGLGSVSLRVNDVKERTVKLENDGFKYNIESTKPKFSNSDLGSSENTIKAFQKMANFDKHPDDAHYPYCVDNNGNHIPENYNWFVGNKQIKDVGKGTNHVIAEHLRPVLDDDYPLSVIEKSGRDYHLLNSSSRSSHSDSFSVNKPNSGPKQRVTSSKGSNKSKPVHKEKSELDKKIDLLRILNNTKRFTKALKQMKSERLEQKHIVEIEKIIKKRNDYPQREYNQNVKNYLKVFKELKSKIK